MKEILVKMDYKFLYYKHLLFCLDSKIVTLRV